jgi:hypothetical protein
LFKVSASTVQRGRDQVALATINPKAAGPFASLLQKPGGTRTKICDIERHATIKWFLSKNPTRSGDTKAIAWMSMEKVDFYFEQYRHCYAGLMKMVLDYVRFMLCTPNLTKLSPNETPRCGDQPLMQVTL